MCSNSSESPTLSACARPTSVAIVGFVLAPSMSCQCFSSSFAISAASCCVSSRSSRSARTRLASWPNARATPGASRAGDRRRLVRALEGFRAGAAFGVPRLDDRRRLGRTLEGSWDAWRRLMSTPIDSTGLVYTSKASEARSKCLDESAGGPPGGWAHVNVCAFRARPGQRAAKPGQARTGCGGYFGSTGCLHRRNVERSVCTSRRCTQRWHSDSGNGSLTHRGVPAAGPRFTSPVAAHARQRAAGAARRSGACRAGRCAGAGAR